MSVPRINLRRTVSSASSSSYLVFNKHKHRHASSMSGSAESSLDYEDVRVGMEIQMTAAVSGVVPDDTFNVSDVVNALGFGKFQLILSFITGLCWMADSVEIMILSMLSPALHCEWGISQYRQAFLTTVVFIGMMTSSVLWGKMSDMCGRRQALLISGFFLFFYGILSAFAPSYNWVLFLRFLVGFNIGCVPQSVTLFSEFLPSKQRAKCVVLLDCFWAFGACLEVLLAAVVMPIGGWRWLLALSSLPSLIFVITAYIWLPESARFNAASGRCDLALETLEMMAEKNNKPMLLGRLVVDDEVTFLERGRFSDLLSRDLRRTTLSLWLIWFVSSFVYYGVVLMTTELFETPGDDICGLDGSLKQTCSAQCSPLDRVDYGHLLWTTMAEFPGIMVTVVLIERLGRIRTMTLQFVLQAFTLCLLFKCTTNPTLVTVILFIIRGVASGVFQAAYVYSSEIYPTILRSVGVGSCSGMARMGAMLTPYIAQVMMKASLSWAVAVYAGVALIAGITCFMLPVETKGKEMKETSKETKPLSRQVMK